ncbi:MAG: inositol monophosphatase [Trueperaceae bacterium]|nr:MAG: inositol monophosphatase [Trueperaceae bacterium]
MTTQLPYLTTAIQAARAAGRIQRYHAGGELEIDTKSTEIDLVTQVDTACEARIREIITGAHPDHAVLGEEGGQEGGSSSHRWIVDPLDGTINYAHDFPFYCVSIALEIDGILEVGVVLDSVRGELFTAVRGQGAFVNGAPIDVSKESEPKKALLATGFSYRADLVRQNLEIFARLLPEVRSIRRPGAAALDLCYVACGRLDGFWELGLNPWDAAAGVLIIQEAGGSISGPSAEPYRLGMDVLVASNGHLHAKLLELLDLGYALA